MKPHFHAYLTNRTQTVADGTQSSHLTIRNGLLFTLYNIILPNQYFNVHFFAKTQFYMPRLHPCTGPVLSSVCLWCLPTISPNHKLVLNSAETQYMVLSTSTCDNFPPIKSLNGTHINLESNKYLGICLDSRLSFKFHIQHLNQKTENKTWLSVQN